MANKYIIHGATYCGDGTASNEAASAGAVGAWNDINVFEGSAPAYGALAAGDVVYIRSKNASDGNITRTLTASVTLGSSAATAAAPICWIVDGGTVWPGIDGTVTYSCPSTYNVTFRGNNIYRADNPDRWVVREANTNSDYKRICYFPSYCVTENLFVDCSLNAHDTGNWMDFREMDNVHRNLHLKWAKHYSAPVTCYQWSKVTLINPVIEMTVIDTRSAVIELGDFSSSITIYGGRLFGTGATTGLGLVRVNSTGRSGRASVVGMQVPKTMNLVSNSTLPEGPWKVEGMGLDGEEGAVIVENWGNADTRSDGYYPTLNAFLPDSVSTPWAWRIYPGSASAKSPFCIPIGKEYTAVSASKTITGYMLIADTVTTANKESMWLEISYIDGDTNLPVSVSTRNFSAAAFDSSTANWSATTYGAINLVKKQISITTPTNIKQNTMVIISLLGKWKAASAMDIMFFCPDVELS